MMRWFAPLVVVAVVAGCKVKPREVGAACTNRHQCASGICVGSVCTEGTEGQACSTHQDCAAGRSCFHSHCRAKGGDHAMCVDDTDCVQPLTCFEQTCLPPDGIAARQREVAAAEENRLLAASGIDAGAGSVAEKAIAPPGPGTRVRTVVTTGTHAAFAACRADERLVGGGCDTARALEGNFPSGNSAEDTVGARWNCRMRWEESVTAYALCEKLPVGGAAGKSE